MNPSFPPKVAAAIAAVMSGVKTLAKSNENQHGRYKFAGIDDFLEATRPLCAQAGLLVLQDEESCEIIGDAAKPWLKITYSFRLAHASGECWDGILRRTVMVDARMGSQAYGAAQSYVLKQFMRSLFQMATGDGEDADTHQPERLPQSRHEPQRQHVEPPKPTLAERADKLEATLKGVATRADLEKAYKLASGLMGELDAKDPERFEAIKALYEKRDAELSPKLEAAE